jgi:hypothetical protein
MRTRRSVDTGKTTLAEESPLPPQLPPSSRIEALSVVHAYPVASVFPALPGAVYVLAMTTATTCSPPTPVAHMPYARSITASASAVAHKAGSAHPQHMHQLYAGHDLSCASVVSRSRFELHKIGAFLFRRAPTTSEYSIGSDQIFLEEVTAVIVAKPESTRS